MENYYRLLGVDRDASAHTVKAAFRALLKQTHPDANPFDESAAERTRRIVQAYQALSSTQQREEYDHQLLAVRHSAYLAVSSGGPDVETHGRARVLAMAAIIFVLLLSFALYVQTVYANRMPEFRPCVNAIEFETADLRLPAVVEPGLREPIAWFRTREFQMSMADPLSAAALTDCCWRATVAALSRKNREEVAYYRQMLRESGDAGWSN